MNYEAYLRSPHWWDIKMRMWKKYKECQACGTKHSLEVHHNKGYANIGHEKLSELRLLCHECHYRRHRMAKGIRYWKPDDVMMRVWVWLAKNYRLGNPKGFR